MILCMAAVLPAAVLPAAVLPAAGMPQEERTLEAEEGTFRGTVQTEIPDYSGSGYVFVKDTEPTSIHWNFSSAASGMYRLVIRYAAGSSKGFAGTMNGAGFSGTFRGTDDAWADFDAGLVALTHGVNSLEIGGGWHWYKIDCVTLTPAEPEPLLPVAGTLSDPKASAAARRLMKKLADDYGRFTWSGLHDVYQPDLGKILDVSGRVPTIIESDLGCYSPSTMEYGENPGNMVEEFMALDASGHVLGLSWHWHAPAHLLNTAEAPWYKGFYTSATTFNIEAALADTNSAEYALLIRDIDAIAVQLGKFSDAGIPVLWRPLHEASGGWFWWGAHGPEPFKALWRLMCDRLTVHHGLHNLIWVMTNPDADWYPGDDVVDLVGIDAYPDDPGTDTLQSGWQELKDLFDGKKMIALTEYGGVPDVERMHEFGTRFSFFVTWTGKWGDFIGKSSDAVINQTYTSPLVITLDEMK